MEKPPGPVNHKNDSMLDDVIISSDRCDITRFDMVALKSTTSEEVDKGPSCSNHIRMTAQL